MSNELVPYQENLNLEPIERTKPTYIVTQFDVSANRIFVKIAFVHTVATNVINNIVGSKYQLAIDTYIVPLAQWGTFLKSCDTNFLGMAYLPGVGEAIHAALNRADYEVELDSRLGRIIIKKRDAGVSNIYQSGISTWHITHDTLNRPISYSISISEAYKLPSVLPVFNKGISFDYSKEVKELLEVEATKRSRLLEISMAEDAPEIKDDISLQLRPFQRVAKAYSLHVNNRAIISYDMGLGKTPIAISIIESLPKDTRVLIVCPATLKTNWKREIKKCTGIDAEVLAGATPSELTVKSLLNPTIKYHIINYDILGRGEKDKEARLFVSPWAHILNLVNFDVIVYDEAHYMKNTDSGRSKAGRQLVSKYVLHLTGTPVVNRPAELWPLLNIISPQTFPSKDSFEGQWFWNNGKSIKDEKMFREMLSAYMIRRKKEDVIKDLPTIERIDYFVEIPEAAWTAYNLALQGVYTPLKRPDFQMNINSILAELQRCKQIIADACASESASLAREINEETEKKVLIFSQFVDSCKEIASNLGPECLCLTGEDSDESRYKKIDKFQTDPNIKYMVLSTKAGSEGITLTAAEYVIFNDLGWTPKEHRQAEARCYGRMNDMHGATAYYIQVEKTITEMIMGILRQKLEIIEASVDGLNSGNQQASSIINEFLNKMRG